MTPLVRQVFAGLALLVLGLSLGAGCGWKAGQNDRIAHYAPMLEQHERAAREAESAHRQAEQRFVERWQLLNDLADTTRRERDEALASLDAAVDAGDLRLRDRFTCPSSRDMPEAAAPAAANVPAAGGGLYREDQQFLVRACGSEPDAIVGELNDCRRRIVELHRFCSSERRIPRIGAARDGAT